MSAELSGGCVRVKRSGPVWTLTLSHPERRNALTWDMYDQLAAACAEAQECEDLRVVVIRGAGGDAFAAGTDIHQFVEFTSGDQGLDYERRVGAVLASIAALNVPVVGVVQGPAVGAGLAIAALCDVLVATPDAVFGVPVARTLGNCLPPHVVARLHSRLGVSRTSAMLLTSTLLTAADCAAAGFVHQVVEPDHLEPVVERLLNRIVSSAPLTVAGLKEIQRRIEASIPAVDADDVLLRCYGSEDFREGVAAFVARRRPTWRGN